MGQNFLKRLMSQLLDNTKKIDINRVKRNRKIIFGSESSETNNELTFRLTKKNDKKIDKKIDKNYFWLRIV